MLTATEEQSTVTVKELREILNSSGKQKDSKRRESLESRLSGRYKFSVKRLSTSLNRRRRTKSILKGKKEKNEKRKKRVIFDCTGSPRKIDLSKAKFIPPLADLTNLGNNQGFKRTSTGAKDGNDHSTKYYFSKFEKSKTKSKFATNNYSYNMKFL